MDRGGGGVKNLGPASGCIICCIVTLAAVIIGIAAIVDGYHKIEEGYVGVYFKFGALQEGITEPGVHMRQPFVSTSRSILIRPEETKMSNVQAITKDGIEITFQGIGVLSRTTKTKVVKMIKEFGIDFKKVLIYDRVKEDLRIFCANKTIDEVYNEQFLEIVQAVKNNVEDQIKKLGEGGVTILNLVISKPDIPQDIAQNYKQVKVQWTEQLVAKQQKVTEEIKKETELLKALADARRQKEVLEIKIQEQILETEGKQKISDINNKIVRDKQNNLADIAKYAKDKEAAGNTALYSPEYVKLQVAQSLTNNTKFFFSGQDSVLGGLLTKILATKR
jgi:regulator of protease activity HflC (stomatin/prohibitin superfamily)